MRAVVLAQTARARTLLASGPPLAATLSGRNRWLIAGFVAGGLATIDAIEQVGGDVLGHRCTAERPAHAGPPRRRPAAGPDRERGGVIDVTAAYAECARITSREAKNFAYGIRLLAAARRDAMSAVYAMARRIDDIGDGDMAADAKLDALDRVRGSIATLEPAR